MKYGIFYNQKAGKGESEKVAFLGKQMIEKNGGQALLISGATLAESISDLKAVLPDLGALLVIGGDGTLNVAMSVIVELDRPLPFGIIPAGTVNNFASYYNLPTQATAAFDMILHQSQIKKVGIAKCKDHQAIASSLTFGNLADIGNEVRQQDKKHLGLLVYLLQALKQIGKNKSYQIEYKIDGKKRNFKTWFALVTTTPSIAGFIYDEESPGNMHLSLLNNIHFKQVFDYLYFAITGKLRASKQITSFQPQKIELKAMDNKKVTVRIDGDKGPELPLTINYLPEYLPLYVSRKEKATSKQ